AGEKISGGVVHERVERTVTPNGVDHFFDLSSVADIARARVDGRSRLFAKLGFRGGEDFVTPSADVDRSAEFEETLSRGFAETCAASSDEDALVFEEIFLKHKHLFGRMIVAGRENLKPQGTQRSAADVAENFLFSLKVACYAEAVVGV